MPGKKNPLLSSGYDAEEMYFHRINQELKERRIRKRGSTVPKGGSTVMQFSPISAKQFKKAG